MNGQNEMQLQPQHIDIPSYSLPAPEKPFSASPELSEDDEVIDLPMDFGIDDFQVVRREFFAHIFEPSITFSGSKFYVNTACLSKFPHADYVQVLVNSNSKILALRPCSESARDSFPWCNYSKGKRRPKQTTCRIFYAKIVSLMGWNPEYRYKMLGKLVHANGEYLLAFDLTATECYVKAKMENGKPVPIRKPVFREEWQDQFGIPYSEHKQSLQINVFDGYAVFAIRDKKPAEQGETEAHPESTESSGSPVAGPAWTPDANSMNENQEGYYV